MRHFWGERGDIGRQRSIKPLPILRLLSFFLLPYKQVLQPYTHSLLTTLVYAAHLGQTGKPLLPLLIAFASPQR